MIVQAFTLLLLIASASSIAEASEKIGTKITTRSNVPMTVLRFMRTISKRPQGSEVVAQQEIPMFGALLPKPEPYLLMTLKKSTTPISLSVLPRNDSSAFFPAEKQEVDLSSEPSQKEYMQALVDTYKGEGAPLTLKEYRDCQQSVGYQMLRGQGVKGVKSATRDINLNHYPSYLIKNILHGLRSSIKPQAANWFQDSQRNLNRVTTKQGKRKASGKSTRKKTKNKRKK